MGLGYLRVRSIAVPRSRRGVCKPDLGPQATPELVIGQLETGIRGH